MENTFLYEELVGLSHFPENRIQTMNIVIYCQQAT